MHYPEDRRLALLTLLKDPASTGEQIRDLLQQFRGCEDTLPGWACDELELPLGSSFANAERDWVPLS